MKKPAGGVVLAILLGVSSNAFALQPLSNFIRESRRHATQNRIARSIVEERNAQKDVTFWKLFPSLQVQGMYRRNPYEISLDVILPNGNRVTRVITPIESISARAGASWTLDLEAYRRFRAADKDVDVATLEAEAEAQEVEIEIARTYYQLLTGVNQVEIAAQGAHSSGQVLLLAQRRFEAGTAPQGDVDRATIELERAHDAQAEFSMRADESIQLLAELSGLAADTSETLLGEIPLPAPLASADPWLSNINSTPIVKVAKANEAAADAKVSSARGAYVPKLTVEVNNTWSNTPGFYGETSTWGVGATATWNFDGSVLSNTSAAKAAKRTASLRRQEAAEKVKREIRKAYAELEARRRLVKTTRLESQLAAKNFTEARARYEGGLETIEVVLQLQREMLAVQIKLTEAYGEYLFTKTLLNITAGKDLTRE